MWIYSIMYDCSFFPAKTFPFSVPSQIFCKGLSYKYLSALVLAPVYGVMTTIADMRKLICYPCSVKSFYLHNILGKRV